MRLIRDGGGGGGGGGGYGGWGRGRLQTKEEVRLLCLYRVETYPTTPRTDFSTQSVNYVLQLKRPVATT